ncbi:MAG: hypothetical protein PHE18_01045 [Candidatus Omnitrophica bacterium]|nr:hypothetical protein [Candidatus Omnitrophota bacterium]MDD5552447.1 hypothetical protein [Candidatus Omnitrophota bacterium]
MAEDIKSLIEKINQEGIAAAEKKAKEIEDKARQEAGRLLDSAKRQAEDMINNAKEQIVKMREKEKASLSQAGRDLLLTLKQEVNAMLQKVISMGVRETLTPENIFKILNSAIKGSCVKESSDIVISLSKEDAGALEGGFLAKLKAETKKQIRLLPSESVGAGFVISFDAGKSQFDFSEKALAEYIGTYLKPKLKELLEA